MNTMLFFNNGNEDAAAFQADDLVAIDAGNDVVNLHFQRGSVLHSVVLACADGASDLLARELAVELSGSKLRNAMVEVANDDTSTYLNSRITGVTSITIDTDPSS